MNTTVAQHPFLYELRKYAGIAAKRLTERYAPEELREIATYGLVRLSELTPTSDHVARFRFAFDQMDKPGYAAILRSVDGNAFMESFVEDQIAIRVYQILKETVGL